MRATGVGEREGPKRIDVKWKEGRNHYERINIFNVWEGGGPGSAYTVCAYIVQQTNDQVTRRNVKGNVKGTVTARRCFTDRLVATCYVCMSS